MSTSSRRRLVAVTGALSVMVFCALAPATGAAQCPEFQAIRWPGGVTVKIDLSSLPSEYRPAAEAAIAKAGTFATATKTGVKFSNDSQTPDTYKVSFVVNTSISGAGQVDKTHTEGLISNAEVRINPDARFEGTSDKVLDPNAPRYQDALILTFFHELLHTFGLKDVAWAYSSFGGSVMNEAFTARNNINDYIAWDATDCDKQKVDQNYEDRTEEDGGASEESSGAETDPRYYEGGSCTIEWEITWVRYWENGSWTPWQELSREVIWTDCPPYIY